MRILTGIFIIILSLFYSALHGQNSISSKVASAKEKLLHRKHHIGLSMAANRNLSLAYRNKRANNVYLRANLNTRINSAFIDALVRDFSAQISLSAGIEKHISLNKKFKAYYGADIGINSLISGYELRSISYSLVGITGINFKANDRVSFFAETHFGMQVNTLTSTQSILWTIRSNNNINFGVLYTIGRTA